jgi:DNA-binding NarL/FixJ family response regulator
MTGRPRRQREPDMRTWRDRLPQPGSPLTVREVEIVQLVAEGLSNPEIGAKLYLTADTVKSHIKRAARKLSARNRAHVVWLAVQRGYLELPESPHGGDEQ